ncbi:TetR/AcrR family transcriptional regulator [Rhodococcus erythropolis]|uniref:TetR family transcriptional regulator n=1 Tax=Rhodococcus erythropolis TaxID=1833 RepID=A0AAX3ZY78_RHOER|nr:TetR family transcriptional regulator [Rhodococcus erythropolis]WMN01748.1 TetR family transcriptional regulator [Rhodococcus erythropolis]
MTDAKSPRIERTSTQNHRSDVLRVAGELFTTQGYSNTGIRQIAARAGIDPALVIRYFGSKENLFLKAIVLPPLLKHAMESPLRGFGERLIGMLISRTREGMTPPSGTVFATLMQASDRPGVQAYFRELLEDMIVSRLAPRLHGSDSDLRARLIAAQINGLLAALYIVEAEVLREAPPAES